MKSKYFFCYDPRLKRFLIANNHGRIITHALHNKTKRPFWLFENDDNLDNGIKKYREYIEQSKVI